MEMGFPMNSELMTIPRGVAMQGVGVDGKPVTGLGWTTKYAAVGMNAVGWPAYVDGMNEKGLIGAMFMALHNAVFEDVAPADSAKSISSAQVPTYVLTNFATVDEIRAGLQKIKVNRSPVGAYNNQIATVHYSFHDASGKSIVVEYLNGRLVISDNPVGALTNDPPFREQLNNIGNYANLSKVERPPLVIN
jgi:choloylglycine hydrolase